MSDPRKDEIARNYVAFQKQLPNLLKTHAGKFALMREEKIIDFFDTARDAYIAGQRLYSADQLFSIQQVIESPIDLGYFSHALPERPV